MSGGSIGDGAKHIAFVPSALITPFTVDRIAGTISGCVYDAAGVRLDISRRVGGHGGDVYTSDDPSTTDPALYSDAPWLDGTTLYLGHYMAHYGHFLLETLSTFWVIATGAAFDRVLFHPFTFGRELYDYAIESFRALGLDPQVVSFVNTPLWVETLIVPERLLEINAWAHQDLIDVHRKIAGSYVDAEKEATGRIYVTRTGTTQRAIANEEAITRLFSEHGFEILSPARSSFREQVAMYATARAIAGFSGSSLHNCLFMRPGGAVLELGDTRARHSSPPTQQICAQLADLHTHFVPFVGRSDERGATVEPRVIAAELDRLELAW